MQAALMLLVTLYLCGGKARAQSITGTIRGHVHPAHGLAPTQDLPLRSQPDIPSVNRQFGSRAALRADDVFRNDRDGYSQRTDVGGTDRRSRTWGTVNGANHVNTAPTVPALLPLAPDGLCYRRAEPCPGARFHGARP